MRDAQQDQHQCHGSRQGSAGGSGRCLGSPQKHVWRARIILLTAEGTVGIMPAKGKSKTCVWRWQERFMVEGGNGVVRLTARSGFVANMTIDSRPAELGQQLRHRRWRIGKPAMLAHLRALALFCYRNGNRSFVNVQTHILH
jgi:hypothetical protein